MFSRYLKHIKLDHINRHDSNEIQGKRNELNQQRSCKPPIHNPSQQIKMKRDDYTSGSGSPINIGGDNNVRIFSSSHKLITRKYNTCINTNLTIINNNLTIIYL